MREQKEMVMAQQGQRKRRNDAGVVRQTGRDAELLTLLSEMYGAPLDLLGAMTGTAKPTTYALIQRWKRAGWVETGRIDAGPTWVWPTTTTARRFLGWDAGSWMPRPTMAAHLRATLAVRLAWCGTALDSWISERKLQHAEGWRKRGEKIPHIPDGVFIDDQAQQWAVEVELTDKGKDRASRTVRNAAGEAARKNAGLIYLCTSGAMNNVRSAMAELPGRKDDLRLMSIEEIPMWRLS